MHHDRDLNGFSIQDALAKRLLKGTDVVCIHKVPRSGCTMSLVKASYKKGKKVAIFAPTIRVLRQIARKIPAITHAEPRIAPVLSNPELCRKTNRNLKLKFQFKENCNVCEFKGKPNKCVLQNLLMNDFDIYCLTYSKLQALLKSTSTEAKILLEKLRSCTVFIFDEFTTAVIIDIPTITVVTTGESKKLVKLSTRLMSSFIDEFERSARRRRESDFWMTILLFLDQFENAKQSDVYKNLVADSLPDDEVRRLFNYGWRRITQLTAEGRDTSKLQDVFLTSLAREIIVTCEDGTVKVTPRLEDALGYIREFCQTLSEEKLIFAVDSYQPSVNFEKLFGRPVRHELWGENGDPLRTNDQQLILSDTAHWGSVNFCRDSFLQLKVQIFIEKLLGLFSAKQIIIVTTNRKMAKIISTWNLPKEVKLTWHRSDWMRGVSVEDRRLMICLGGSYLPKIAYVSEAHSFDFNDFAKELEDLPVEQQVVKISRILKADDTKSEFINAVGRVKDPASRERSLVITLGMNYNDVHALMKQKTGPSVSQPNMTRPFRKGGLQRDGLWVAKLWFDKASVEVEDLPIVARIVRYVVERKSVSASQVIPHQTELVIEKATQYKEILRQYSVIIVSKQGGVSFEQS